MTTKRFSFYVLTALFFFSPVAASAAPKPDLYPNAYLKKVGAEQARNDAAICGSQAEEYLSGTKRGVVGDAARGAARGAAKGALAGAILNDKAGRGAGAGAALGGLKAAGTNVREEKEGSPEYRKYVEACLEEKGYRVVGWK